MIGHNNKGMQVTETSSVGLTQLFLNQAGYLRLPGVKRAVPSGVEQPVPNHERLAGSQMFGMEDPLRRKAAPGPPREERGFPRSLTVWQAARVGSHTNWCNGASMILRQGSGAQAPRGLKPAPQRPAVQLIAGDWKWKIR
jgi:hypothetical protein